MSTAHRGTFHFGVEIELLLGSRKKHSTWTSLAEDLGKSLVKAGIPNHVNNSNDKTVPSNYREWSITQEITIPSQPGKNLFGIELVSPIYDASFRSQWVEELSKIFSTLSSNFIITPSEHCSTHIHISCVPTFSPTELASLSKCILYFEPALDSLFPANRRGSSAYWCQSNRSNPALRGLSTGEALGIIDAAATTGSAARIIEVMNLFPADSAYGRANGRREDFVRGKVYKWDLTGLLGVTAGQVAREKPGFGIPSGTGGGNVRGTIEFRQPPGSLTANEAVGGIEVAVSFVAGALMVGSIVERGREVLDAGGPREELWALLASGAKMLG